MRVSEAAGAGNPRIEHPRLPALGSGPPETDALPPAARKGTEPR
jgi:hypothetical protein